jgi:aspartate aminotransferase-like enzyme
VIRIGTMGSVSDADIRTDLMHLEATLKDLGRTI